ncbi:MAG: hypothetical protein PHE24_00975 [Patescibacteria group bacterium]|nr:hypothetical protein [Patescibacteria group bacterium]
MFKKFANQKSLSAIFMSIFAVVFLAQTVAFTALFFMPAAAQAAPYPPLTLQVPIPTLHGGSATVTFNGTTAPIADYIKAIYSYAVGVVGIVAAVILMIGGLMWITAGGNASNVTEAKAMITASLTGFVLVLVSYLLLNQINPALVNLQSGVIGTPTVTQQITTGAPLTIRGVCDWIVQTTIPGLGITGGCFAAGQASDDVSACTKAMPASPGQNSTYKCCCSYIKDPTTKCYWSSAPVDSQTLISNNGADYCKANESFSTGDEAVKKCGTLGNANWCCCPAVSGPVTNAAGCIQDPTINCSTCLNCQSLPDAFKYLDGSIYHLTKNDVKLNSDFLNKLNVLSQTVSFTIREAWPPTVTHLDSCHANGTCADITADGVDTPAAIKADQVQIQNAGLKSVYECYGSVDCCTPYTNAGVNCKKYPTGTGTHLHVEP